MGILPFLSYRVLTSQTRIICSRLNNKILKFMCISLAWVQINILCTLGPEHIPFSHPYHSAITFLKISIFYSAALIFLVICCLVICLWPIFTEPHSNISFPITSNLCASAEHQFCNKHSSLTPWKPLGLPCVGLMAKILLHGSFK